MAGRSRFSEDEIKRISCRIKSARTLSGLNQEDFAKKYDISYMSIKCWEIGRAVPREENLEQFLNAIKTTGIEVSSEWIFFGSGPGPTYLNSAQVEKKKSKNDYLGTQIDFFKKEQLKQGLNPIVVTVDDELMAPQYKKGHIIGGVFTTINKLRNELPLDEILSTPWLVMVGESSFAPRYLLLNSEQVFIRSNKELELKTCLSNSLGKICWHYFAAEHT